jgi:hypothetical protein
MSTTTTTTATATATALAEFIAAELSMLSLETKETKETTKPQETKETVKPQESEEFPRPLDTTILFHGNCIDGWFSAYFAYTALTIRGASIQMFPIAPSQRNTWPDPSEMENTTIWLLDVSVTEEDRSTWLKEGALHVRCIDHHTTAKLHWPDATIDTNTCAAVQAHREFFPHLPIPEWLHSIDRVDRWENVTYEDRCLREFFSGIAHLPVEKKINDAILLTNHFLESMARDPITTLNTARSQGEVILKEKDAYLYRILSTQGKVIQITQEHVTEWRLPSSWLDKTLLLMDTTSITLDTTEAAHLAFVDDPKIEIFINYRKKTYYDVPKGARPDQRHDMIVYSARSRTLDLTVDSIFQGHPTAAGATLVLGVASHLPFLLDPSIAECSKPVRRPRIVNPVKTPVIKYQSPRQARK